MNPFSPMSAVLLSACLDLFKNVSGYLLILLGAFVMLRILVNLVSFSGGSAYAEIFTDLAKYLGLVSIFPFLMRMMMDVIASISQKMSYTPVTKYQEAFQEFCAKMFNESYTGLAFARLFSFLFVASVQGIYSLLIGLIIAIGPVIIFLSCILGLSIGIREYFNILLSLSLWPVLWNILGLLGRHVGAAMPDDPLTGIIFWILIQVLQLLSPVVAFFIFQSGSPQKVMGKIATVASKVM